MLLMQNNEIESVTISTDLDQLLIVDLSHNCLTSVGSLNNCTNICNLNLSYNKIVRLGKNIVYLFHLNKV